jgi:hypothetical protein
MELIQESIPSNGIPRPFGEVVKLWLKVARMSESFFHVELGHVSVPNTLLGILVVAVFTAATSIVSSVISSSISSARLPSAEITQFMSISKILLPICSLITTPILFYLNIGLFFVCASIFGGKGKFNSQAYLTSLFFVPLSIISGFVGFLTYVPVIGAPIIIIAALGISIIQWILTFRVLKVVHQLTTGKAATAVLLPLILIVLPAVMIMILALLGPAISNIFTEIFSVLETPVP